MRIFHIIRALLFNAAPRLQPRDCAPRVRAGKALLVDVREPREWNDGVAESAVLLSFKDLIGDRTQWTHFLENAGNRELLFYCGAGVRAAMAARILATEGFRTANTGRLTEWADAGWPVVKPPAPSGMPQ